MSERSERPGIFGFPDPVDEVSARLVAAGVVGLATLTIATRSPIPAALLAYGFVARVAAGPTLSPLGRLVTQAVRPRLDVAARPVPGPPKRFAQGVGAVFSTAALVLLLLGATTAAVAVLVVLVTFALLESVLGFCMGCVVFGRLMRLGVIPADVCERCNDLWA